RGARARHGAPGDPRRGARAGPLPGRGHAAGRSAFLSTLRAAALLARKDLLLEARSKDVTLAMTLFALATLVLTHYAIAGTSAHVPVRVGSGVVWLAILLASLLGLQRLFAAERDEGLLDALLLAPVSRSAIWLSKALALAALLVVLEVVLVPLHWLFFYADA